MSAQQNGFTQNADLYRVSQAHSETEDLELAVESLPTLFGMAALDVATGTGHTAFFLAQKGAHVFAVDLNHEMLRVAQEESDRLTHSVRFLVSSAEDLNFDDHSFDLVTTRLATHHFDNIPKFLQESRRVLRPGGHLLIVDNVVAEDPAAAEWMNDFEKRRDPSHRLCLTVSRWESLLADHGFEVTLSKRFPKTIHYTAWMQRMSCDQEQQDRLWNELEQAPDQVRAVWNPHLTEAGERRFVLQRGILIAQASSTE